MNNNENLNEILGDCCQAILINGGPELTIEHASIFVAAFINSIRPKDNECSYQSRVRRWMEICFGLEDSNDIEQRRNRFMEESLELFQAASGSEEDARQLVNYVFSRNVGEINQEAGGALLTLAGLCSALSIDLECCGEKELHRNMMNTQEIRKKHLSRPSKSPLPQ